jgi:hypothetical protein
MAFHSMNTSKVILIRIPQRHAEGSSNIFKDQHWPPRGGAKL